MRQRAIRVGLPIAAAVGGELIAIIPALLGGTSTGPEIQLGFYSAIAAALPVFLLAFIVRMREERNVWVDVYFRRAKLATEIQHLRHELSDVRASATAGTGLGTLARVRETENRLDRTAAELREMTDRDPDDDPYERYRALMLGVVIAGILVTFVGEAAALGALANGTGTALTFGLTFNSGLGLFVYFATWEIASLASRLRTG